MIHYKYNIKFVGGNVFNSVIELSSILVGELSRFRRPLNLESSTLPLSHLYISYQSVYTGSELHLKFHVKQNCFIFRTLCKHLQKFCKHGSLLLTFSFLEQLVLFQFHKQTSLLHISAGILLCKKGQFTTVETHSKHPITCDLLINNSP